MRPDLRVVRALGLVAWAAFFLWLVVTSAYGRFVGPRTAWVVYLGAVSFPMLALAALVSLRPSSAARAAPRDLLGVLLLLLPTVALLAVPKTDLGPRAAARKAARLGAAAQLPVHVENAPPPKDVRFRELEVASSTPSYARWARVEGRRVDLVGFVTRRLGGGAFQLTRFYTSCCAADAEPYSVEVISASPSAAPPAESAWLDVTGVVRRRGRAYVVEPSAVKRVHPPGNRFLAP